MKKWLFIGIFMFLAGSCQVSQAFSFKDLFQSAQQKACSTSNFLVNNAWRIAGVGCFATAAVSAGILAKNTFEGIHANNALAPILTQNAVRLLLPLGTSILGLLCFNVDTQIKSTAEIVETQAKESAEINEGIFNIMNNVQELIEKKRLGLHNQ